MRRSKFTDDEIAMWLLDADQGMPIEGICRSANISMRTFYRWRERFGSLSPKAIRHIRELEEENRALKQTLKLTSAKPSRSFREATPGSVVGNVPTSVQMPSTRVASTYRICRSS